MAAERLQETISTEVMHDYDAALHDALVNATITINKETPMSERNAQTGRPSVTEASDTIHKTTNDTISRLLDDREIAVMEESYWRDRKIDIDASIKALEAANKVFNEYTTSLNSVYVDPAPKNIKD